MYTNLFQKKAFWFLLLFCVVQVVFTQNMAPNASDDTYTVGYNITRTIVAENGVLENDTDPNDSASLIVNPTPLVDVSSGILVLNTDGSFTYTPSTNFIGTDAFTYQVCDNGLPGEIVSQFDFDSPVLTDATIGPNATSINPDAVAIECGVHIPRGSTGGNVGLDLIIPNTGNIFNFTSFKISFDYRDQESSANLVEGGNFRLYHIRPNDLGVQVTVINGDTGLRETFTQNLGAFLAGNASYEVTYSELTGEIQLDANGTVTTFPLAPAFSPLDTSLVSDITVGRQLDNAGRDFASFCNVTVEDQSVLCDTALVTLDVRASVITNRKITYRVKRD